MTRVGIPNFEATPEERKLVEMVAGVGLSHAQIVYLIERRNADGAMVPISIDTLTRHFHDELTAGKAKTIAKVAGKLVSTALGPPSAQATTSQIFYLKTQAGWKETVGIEVPEATDEGADPVALAARVAGLIEKGRRSRKDPGDTTH